MKFENGIEVFINDYGKDLNEGTASVFAGAGLSIPAGFVNWSDLMTNYVDTETKYMIGGKPALRYYAKGGQSPQQGKYYATSMMYIVNDNYAFQISYRHDSDDQNKIASTEKKFLEIISTLKFSH